MTASGRVTTFETDIPRLGVKGRRAWCYLPPGYGDTEKRYPVLYMQDGQNLFDPAASYAGEWGVDKALDRLFAEGRTGGVIAVGLENGREERLTEYSPWPDFTGRRGGRGAEYAEFLAGDFKRLVDSRFRTLPGRRHTAVAGSSLGGLISLYAALKYTEVYSMAGVLSPAFWFARPAVMAFVGEAEPAPGLRVYLDAGTEEGFRKEEYVGDARTVSGLLARKPGVEQKLLIEEGGLHNEESWKRRFPGAFLWLFGGL